jgi:hypothetical protein
MSQNVECVQFRFRVRTALHSAPTLGWGRYIIAFAFTRPPLFLCLDGLSVHNEPGGAANVQPIKSEEELKAKLLEFGASDDYANDILKRLKEKHASVKIDFPAA